MHLPPDNQVSAGTTVSTVGQLQEHVSQQFGRQPVNDRQADVDQNAGHQQDRSPQNSQAQQPPAVKANGRPQGESGPQSNPTALGATALIELAGLVTAESSPAAAQKVLASRLLEYLQAQEVAVAICKDESIRCEIGWLQTSENGPISEPLQKEFNTVAQESIARRAAGIYPAQSDDNRFALLAHRQLALQLSCKYVVSCPLTYHDGTVGSIIATFSCQEMAHHAYRFLFASAEALARALQVNQQLTETMWQKCKRSLQTLLKNHKFQLMATLLFVCGACLCLPVTYEVHCNVELQPKSRRYIAAPFAAPLKTCFVEPGDVVEAHQCLATLNDTELQFELAAVQADFAGAATQRNGYLAERSLSDAEVALFEMQKLSNRNSLLKNRSQRVDVCSPIAGVVVAGDLKEQEGVPLELGQTMFEVAPLDQLLIEIAIPEADFPYVQANQTLLLRLDSDPASAISATVKRIHPKAEVREHENVFIAEAVLPNTDLRFRPGMKGHADIATQRHLLGWNLFHKPVEKFIGWLGW